MMLRVVDDAEIMAPVRDVAIIIPARFGSVRFPGKPLVELRGVHGQSKSLVRRSWDAARSVVDAEKIWIATDDMRIESEARRFGAQVVLTPPDCRNGTERCWAAAAAAKIDTDLIIHLPGDAPLTPPLAIETLISTMAMAPEVRVATMTVRCSTVMADRLISDNRMGRSGGTTVVFDRGRDALYFSKRVIPYAPERMIHPPIYLHLGLYGYRREALEHYTRLDPTPLEQIEDLEQLRFLDAGIAIRMIEVCAPPGGIWEVKSPVDVVPVEAALVERHLD